MAERRWACENEGCPRGTFTESLPAVQPRARLTARLRTRIGEAIGDDLMPAAQAARRYGVSARTAAAAFTAYAGTQLADLRDHQGPAEAAGIDEFRRGIPGPAPGDGQARSEWFTHLVDLGDGGTLGLAQERTGEAGKSLLDSHAGKLRYLAMDLSAPYRSSISAGVTASPTRSTWSSSQPQDRRRVPQLGTAPSTHARTSACPASSLHAPVQHREPGPDHLDTIITTSTATVTAADRRIWIAKEQLRACSPPRTKTHVTRSSAVRDKLAAFYLWCAGTPTSEIKTSRTR